MYKRQPSKFNGFLISSEVLQRTLQQELEEQKETDKDTPERRFGMPTTPKEERLSQALNTYLTFRSAADVREEQMRAAAQSLGSAVYYPVLSAAVTLLREAGRPNVCLLYTSKGQRRPGGG